MSGPSRRDASSDESNFVGATGGDPRVGRADESNTQPPRRSLVSDPVGATRRTTAERVESTVELCRSDKSTPLRVQVHHARPPPVEPAEPFGLKAPTAASRSPMHAALARSPEPAPAGGRARCWPRPPTEGQLSGRARRAERLAAAQRRPKKKLGLMGHREKQIRHGGRHQSVLRGKPFL